MKKLLKSSESALPEVSTARLVLRHARPSQAAQTVAFFERNREHFRRWDPPVPDDFYTLGYWQRNLARAVDDFHADRAVRFDLHLEAHGQPALVGRIGFSQIVRGPFQSCMLGYQIDAAHEGQGFMSEALRGALDYMFRVRGLHRVQANHLEENERSARVLARVGFQREGLARSYLFIDGQWRDHIMTACLNHAYDAAPDTTRLGAQGSPG